jgi:nucleotide-binding universal stress UspA family protein
VIVVDKDATVGGLAGGLGDLAAIGAFDVEIERCDASAARLSQARLAALGNEHDASLVVVGATDPGFLAEGSMPLVEGLADRPVLYVWVNSPSEEPALPNPHRLLRHVLAPGDYSVRSACAAACLLRIASTGARVVTLMHVREAEGSRHQPCPGVGEIGRVDMEWIEHLKRNLLSAGVEEVRFLVPSDQDMHVLEDQRPSVSLVVAGGTCNAEIARSYGRAAMELFASGQSVPALMLTAEGSCSASTSGAAA